MTLLRRRLVAAVAFVGLSCGSALAQGGAPPPGPPDVSADLRPGEVQRLFDAYLLMEAQRALGLSEQQYPQFVSRLRALQDTRRRNQQQRNEILGELQRLSGGGPDARRDDAAMAERLTALQELEARAVAESRKAYTSLAEVLDVRQQARLRVFEEQMERRKLELLLRARARQRLGDAPRRGGAPRPPGQ